jgi:hypothetical protein
MAEQAKESGTVDQLPLMLEGVDEEEAMMLALKAMQEQMQLKVQQAPPRYAATVMSVGLSEEEAIHVSMEASCVAPPPSSWEPLQATAYHIPPPPPTVYPLPSWTANWQWDQQPPAVVPPPQCRSTICPRYHPTDPRPMPEIMDPMQCYKRDKQITKNEKENTAETQDFNVENPSTTEGKIHGRQLAKFHYIGRCLHTPWVILYSDKP